MKSKSACSTAGACNGKQRQRKRKSTCPLSGFTSERGRRGQGDVSPCIVPLVQVSGDPETALGCHFPFGCRQLKRKRDVEDLLLLLLLAISPKRKREPWPFLKLGSLVLISTDLLLWSFFSFYFFCSNGQRWCVYRKSVMSGHGGLSPLVGWGNRWDWWRNRLDL